MRAVLVGVAVLVACKSAPQGETFEVGPIGGTFTTSDGFTLTVPSGRLATTEGINRLHPPDRRAGDDGFSWRRRGRSTQSSRMISRVRARRDRDDPRRDRRAEVSSVSCPTMAAWWTSRTSSRTDADVVHRHVGRRRSDERHHDGDPCDRPRRRRNRRARCGCDEAIEGYYASSHACDTAADANARRTTCPDEKRHVDVDADPRRRRGHLARRRADRRSARWPDASASLARFIASTVAIGKIGEPLPLTAALQGRRRTEYLLVPEVQQQELAPAARLLVEAPVSGRRD